jgi:hypothetical protein
VVFGMSTAAWTGGGPAVAVDDDSPKTPKKPTPNATVMSSKKTVTPTKIRISTILREYGDDLLNLPDAIVARVPGIGICWVGGDGAVTHGGRAFEGAASPLASGMVARSAHARVADLRIFWGGGSLGPRLFRV